MHGQGPYSFAAHRDQHAAVCALTTCMQSFYQVVSRSALMTKVVDILRLLAGVSAWKAALLDQYRYSTRTAEGLP